AAVTRRLAATLATLGRRQLFRNLAGDSLAIADCRFPQLATRWPLVVLSCGHPARQCPCVKGSIVTRARFPEGTRLTLVPHDDGPPVGLDPDEEAGVLKGIAEIAAGRGIPVRTVRRKLRGRP